MQIQIKNMSKELIGKRFQIWRGIKMKKSKEYRISTVLFGVALVLYCISIITGLIPELSFAIDKICMYLGFAFFCSGLVFLKKSKTIDHR